MKIAVKGHPARFTAFEIGNAGIHLEAAQMPGQCSTLVVTSFVGKNVPQTLALLNRIQQVAETDGYPCLMATLVDQQEVGHRALKEHGWEMFWELNNIRTHNRVTWWRKLLPNAVPGIHGENRRG